MNLQTLVLDKTPGQHIDMPILMIMGTVVIWLYIALHHLAIEFASTSGYNFGIHHNSLGQNGYGFTYSNTYTVYIDIIW